VRRAPSLIACLALAVALAAATAPAGGKSAPSPPSCPEHPATNVAANSWAPARRELLPPGALALRLCRYDGFAADARPPVLAAQRGLTGGTRIAQLAKDLDALPPFPEQALPCPLDNGSQVDVLAVYPDGHRVTVQYATTGCNRVSNGDVTAIANGYRDAALAARVRRELTSGY
jgi:hypothetical protein